MSSTACPLCGGMDFHALASNDRYGMGVRTAGCMQCGLLQTWPRPTPEAMMAFYRDHYREYYQATPKPDAQYAGRYRKDERLAYTARLIDSNVILGEGMRVLDVGCAEGTLFAQLNGLRSGMRFIGVEPSVDFAAYASETTGCATFSDLEALFASGEDSFDLIVINHVLEHVDDPVSFLRRLAGLLSRGGSIYLDVPDADCYRAPDSLHIAHLFHFSPRTLLATLERAGLRVIATACHSPPHHPASIWCVARLMGGTQAVRMSDPEAERVAWDAVRGIERALPLYLLRRRLRTNRVASKFVRIVRALRERVAR